MKKCYSLCDEAFLVVKEFVSALLFNDISLSLFSLSLSPLFILNFLYFKGARSSDEESDSNDEGEKETEGFVFSTLKSVIITTVQFIGFDVMSVDFNFLN